jgi:cytochrome P450
VNSKSPKTKSDSANTVGNLTSLQSVSLLTVFRNRKRILANPLPFHHENFEKFGNTFKVDIGPKNKVIFTRDAGIIQYILQKNHRNYSKSKLQTRDVAKYIGKGLLTSEGDFWRRHRKMIQPAFHKQKLQLLFDRMLDAITNELGRIPENQMVDIFPYMSQLAFQVVAQSLFQTPNLREDMNRLQDIAQENQQMLIQEMRQPYFKWWFRLSGKISSQLKMTAEARNILKRLIENRMQTDQRKGDLLDMLLEARYEDGTGMSITQLIDEVFILFTAGHETTANALSFTFHLLATHPEVQQQVYDEVCQQEFERGNLMHTLQGLSYTQQCIEEALRLYPPAYVIDRLSLSEDTIGGNSFKKGTTWLMSLYELHRHEDLWENPQQFDPARFEKNQAKQYSHQYFPFGAGPRMCIGNNFAMYEMVLTVGWLIRKYQIYAEHKTLKINPLISLKPGVVRLRMEPRNS